MTLGLKACKAKTNQVRGTQECRSHRMDDAEAMARILIRQSAPSHLSEDQSKSLSWFGRKHPKC